MPTSINGNTFYRISEVCRIAGISRSTFSRWVRTGKIADSALKDRRGWRIFSASEIALLKTEAK
ncbi:MAG TPA: helix-turn-helix domain-containing protein [Dehalococcoidia bacterium]|nr:helix-turn-helix domain-containing protein [Dehalococcoidia bacterium]